MNQLSIVNHYKIFPPYQNFLNGICACIKHWCSLFCLTAERNEIHAKFSESILDMQQKSGLKYMVLEKKITAMREELDVKDAQMHDIVKVTQASDRGIFKPIL